MFANGAIAYRLIRHSFIWSALVTRGEFPPPSSVVVLIVCLCCLCARLPFLIELQSYIGALYCVFVRMVCSDFGWVRFALPQYIMDIIIYSVCSPIILLAKTIYFIRIDIHSIHLYMYAILWALRIHVCVCVRVLGLSMPSHSYQFCYGFATLRHTLYYMAFMTFAS